MTLVVNSKTTKAQLEAEVARLQAEQETSAKALEVYKDRVREAAFEAKENNDWCDEGFAEAMRELGIDLPSAYRRVTIVVDLDMTDGRGPFGVSSADLADYEDSDISDEVIEALRNSNYDKSTATITVETLTDKPEKLFVEKVRSRSYGGF